MASSGASNPLREVGEVTGTPVYYDDRAGTYHAWFGEGNEPVSTVLVQIVSAVLGVEPADLEALGECVDPDALTSIFVHWRGDEPRLGEESVTFGFSSCSVTMRGDGEVVIDPEEVTDPAP